MRLRGPAAVAGCLLIATATAHAVIPRPPTRIAAEHLTALPAAGVAKPLRSHVDLRWGARPSAAWSKFTAAAGGTWRAAYDRATGVPSRIWGSGIPAPGAVASPQIAEQLARQLLVAHLDLLAPGTSVADFELASNHEAGGVRSVGFVQKLGARRVVGGQVSFRFKHDRLVVIASEALPDVAVTVPRARLERSALRARAMASLRTELALPAAPVTEPGDEVVLPLVAEDAVLGYRVARPVTIDGGADGRYLAYADVATGEILAVQQLNTYASGTLQYRGVDRHPGRGRIDLPASRAHVLVGGAPQTTRPDGTLEWGADTQQTVTTTVTGDLVKIVSKHAVDAPAATGELSIAPGGNVVWDASADALADAQVNVFVATNVVKDYVERHLDPHMPKLGEQMTANVNIGQECNAFFDGNTINFFQSSMRCQNTGLLPDVVYHEFGHALHIAEIIEGVGKFDGAMSEGAADFLAASITSDPGMGRGFFYSDQPLRHIDPQDREHRWPEDVREIHYTGLIYAGALWDLRKDLIAAFGEEEAVAIVNKLYVGTLRRSTNIPTSLIEALVEDDDDGDLANGTPHECFIRSAYGRHGIRTATGGIVAPDVLADRALSTLVRIELDGLSSRCESDQIESVTLAWRPDEVADAPIAGEVVATAASTTSYWAQLPLALEGKVLYRARVEFTDGSVFTLADNLADPYYQLYQGHTVPLYCTDFEDGDPFTQGWTTGTTNELPSPWEWGPAAVGSTDPTAAFSGDHLLGQKIGGEYKPGYGSWVKMPPIDVGRWSDVRLQYRRWLGVEDHHYDQARVLVNDREVWRNATANQGDSSALHHLDREWRFHDVPLSGKVPGTVFQVGWDLHTDLGLQFGGWSIDDVCIVANINSICGDGVTSRTEGCDEGAGNADLPNRCRTWCQLPMCGDGIVDDGEQCDHGLGGDATCSETCEEIELPDLGGCCSSSGGPGASLALSAVVGGLALRRRRRRVA